MRFLSSCARLLGTLALCFGCSSSSSPADEPGIDLTAASPGCKRGIAYAGKRLEAAPLSKGLAWWYNWSAGADASPASVAFVPMVRAEADIAEADKVVSASAAYLLGFNEPNFFSQANLSASAAAMLWPQLEKIADPRQLALVSPAVNFCGDDKAKTGPCHDTNPVHYLTDFFAACSSCRVDYVAVHWYNCDTDSLQSYLGQFKQFGRPIWLTEFACAYGGDRSVAGQEKYMRAALPVLEADPDVFRYAWFSASPIPEAQLIDPSGGLTHLGEVYVSLAHDPACGK